MIFSLCSTKPKRFYPRRLAIGFFPYYEEYDALPSQMTENKGFESGPTEKQMLLEKQGKAHESIN